MQKPPGASAARPGRAVSRRLAAHEKASRRREALQYSAKSSYFFAAAAAGCASLKRLITVSVMSIASDA